MEPIRPPVTADAGPEPIAHLQRALALFVARETLGLDAREQDRFRAGLARERGEYGDFTRKLVSVFQERRNIAASGEVDDPTAAAMNSLLRELGELDDDAQAPVVEVLRSQARTLEAINADTGRLASIDTKLDALNPPGEIRVGARGEEMRRVQGQLAALGVALPANETEEGLFGVGTRTALLELQEKYDLARTGQLDDATRHTLQMLADNVEHPRRVEGRILLANGLPAAGVRVRVVDRGFGDAASVLGEVETDDRGFYALPYGAGAAAAANLEIQALDPTGSATRLSSPVVAADPHTVLNLVAPTSVTSTASEFTLLANDLASAVGGDLVNLLRTREDDDRQDLSLLHEATGWDARLIGVAAQAAQTSHATGLPHAVVYAAVRAGLPDDPQALAEVTEEAFATALSRAVEAGVVTLEPAELTAARRDFAAYSLQTRRRLTTPGALSSVGDLLDHAPVAAEHRATFETLALDQADLEGPALWAAARERGIPQDTVDKLQLQGKLAFLTLNNAPLVESLQADLNSQAELPKLVEHDFHRAAAWEARLHRLATVNGVLDEARLATLVPPAYEADDLAERVGAYTRDLAAQVRRTYPGQVVQRRIATGELRLGKRHDELQAPVQVFLGNALPIGFQLGRVPFAKFKAEQGETVFAGMAAEQRTLAEEGVRMLTRVYQLTPDDESMAVLLELGFTSAWQVAAVDKHAFVERYWHKFGSRLLTEKVWEKSSQITSVTFNVFTMAQRIDATPPVHALTGGAAQLDQSRQELNEVLKAYPTLESLFGTLDFCECEHCRSVLSPAAYLVDLLKFLDPDETVWEQALTDWQNRHDGKAYDGPEYQYLKPYDALTERRPDLPHLALTCENTNTALPYIDLVNEILEYYVAHGQLDPAAGHDTDTDTSAELLAEPHHVVPAAYELLRKARYPLSLPFDLWLETARRFCEHFGVPLWEVQEVFRPRAELFPSTPDPTDYARAQVWTEQLGLSRDEVELFTDDDFSAWPQLYGLAGTAAQAVIELKSARTLADRLGVSYRDLTELIQTNFTNPALDQLRISHTLGLELGALVRYQQGTLTTEEATAVEAVLTAATATYQASTPGFDAAAWLDAAWTAGTFADALVLRDDDAGGGFDKTMLQHADGSDPTPLDLVRLNLFVRLRRRLGWSTAETDRALQVCVPSTPVPSLTTIGAALRTGLVHLAHLIELGQLLGTGKNGRLLLTTLWADLPTRGRASLYAKLFLTRSILKDDPAFDHPLGRYLSAPDIRIADHLPAVQAALALTADDVAGILADGNSGDEARLDKASLTLANVSLLHRYRLLAKVLKVSVGDLIELKSLSGLDPFHPLHDSPLGSLDDDHGFGQTLAFVRAVQRIKDGALGVTELNHLFRHRFDPTGPLRPDEPPATASLLALASTFRSLAADYAVPDDPSQVSDDAMKARLLLVFAPEIVETFMGFWTDQATYSATAAPVASEDRIPPAVYRLPGVSLSYDETRARQQVSHTGVLTEPARDALLAQAPQPDPGDPHAVAAHQCLVDLVNEITAKSKLQFREFFSTHFDGLLEFDDFFGAAAAATPAERRRDLLAIVLPFLHGRLALQAALQAMADRTGGDPALLEFLLTVPAALSLPPGQNVALLDELLALGAGGWSAETFPSADLTGPAQLSLQPDVEVAGGAANSGRWRATVEVPQAGAYRWYARLGRAGASVSIRCDQTEFLQGAAAQDNAEVSGFVELRPGQPYAFTVEVRNLQGGACDVTVKGETTPRTPSSRAPLAVVPASVRERAEQACLLLGKAVRLVGALGLSVREVRHILNHPADFGGVDLRRLPTVADDAHMVQLWRAYLALLGYTALKAELSARGDDLIAVFELARTAPPPPLPTLVAKLATLTRRAEATVGDVAAALKLATPGDFGASERVARLWRALGLVQTLGVTMASLRAWLTAAPDATTARQVRDAVKSRYETEAWHRVGQSIFDPLRARQRDALVAYIRQLKPELDSLERLFEYFLIDPGMEPVVQTSRLRLAISSVQTFVQRCFLNLEKRVHPSVLNARHWAWMKRYRVWEANRKIFLFPENWLEPEWRDDKTHLYTELEGKLLQGDVTTELAEDALFGYLTKLDQLARLEIVATYAEEKPLAPVTLHVIGRTHTQPRLYFYRRYDRQMWTPWEPIPAEIEGDHLVAAIWRERLHLFWLTFMERVESSGKPSTTEQGSLGSLPMNKLVAAAGAAAEGASGRKLDVQLSWSERFQGEWTKRETSGFGNVVITTETFEPLKVSLSVSKDYDADTGTESALWITIHGVEGVKRGNVVEFFTPAFRIVSRNSPPQYTGSDETIPWPYNASGRRLNHRTSNSALAVKFVKRIVTTDGFVQADPAAWQPILEKTRPYSLLSTSNRLSLPNAEFAPLISPVFYADERNTFFMEPSLTEITVDRWEGYSITKPGRKRKWSDFVEAGPKLGAVVPPKYVPEIFRIPKGDPLPDPIDPRALHKLRPNDDLLTQPDVALQFGKVLVNGSGRVLDVPAAGINQIFTQLGGAL